MADPGVAFRELIVPGTSSQDSDRDWASNPPSWKLDGPYRSHRNKDGPRCLLDMALDVVMDHMTKDSEWALASLDAPHLLERIWNRVKHRRLSFYQWRVFSKLLLRESKSSTMALYRYRHRIRDPTSELGIYTSPLSSPSLDFVTSLVIENVHSVRTDELKTLAYMPNLGILIISARTWAEEVSFVTDRLVRGWSEVPQAFPALRALSVTDNRDISKISIKYVSTFPSLALFSISGSRRRHHWLAAERFAEQLGWLFRTCSDEGYETPLPHGILSEVSRAICSLAQLGGDPALPKEDEKLLARIFARNREVVQLDGAPPSTLGDHLGTDKAPQQTSLRAASQSDSTVPMPLDANCFWLYSILSQNADTEHMGRPLRQTRHAHCKGHMIPPIPFVSLHLGKARTDWELEDHRRTEPSLVMTYTRIFDKTTLRQEEQALEAGVGGNESSAKKRAGGPSISPSKKVTGRGSARPKKLQRLGDLLGPFAPVDGKGW